MESRCPHILICLFRIRSLTRHLHAGCSSGYAPWPTHDAGGKGFATCQVSQCHHNKAKNAEVLVNAEGVVVDAVGDMREVGRLGGCVAGGGRRNGSNARTLMNGASEGLWLIEKLNVISAAHLGPGIHCLTLTLCRVGLPGRFTPNNNEPGLFYDC